MTHVKHCKLVTVTLVTVAVAEFVCIKVLHRRIRREREARARAVPSVPPAAPRYDPAFMNGSAYQGSIIAGRKDKPVALLVAEPDLVDAVPTRHEWSTRRAA